MRASPQEPLDIPVPDADIDACTRFVTTLLENSELRRRVLSDAIPTDELRNQLLESTAALDEAWTNDRVPLAAYVKDLGLPVGARDALGLLLAFQSQRRAEHRTAIQLDNLAYLVRDHQLHLNRYMGPGTILCEAGMIEPRISDDGSVAVAAAPRLFGLANGRMIADPRISDFGRWHRVNARDALGVIPASELEVLLGETKGLAESCRPPVISIAGANGVGRTRLSSSLATATKSNWLLEIEVSLLPRDFSALANALRLAHQDAQFFRAPLCLRGIDRLDKSRCDVVAAAVNRFTNLTFLTTTDDDCSGFESMIALKMTVASPSRTTRLEGWIEELGRRAILFPPEDADALAIAHPICRSAIARAVDIASSDHPISLESLSRAAAMQVRSQLTRYATRLTTTQKFADLVVSKEIEEQLLELYDAVVAKPALHKQLGPQLKGPRGIAALFNGPPGTGKTMSAGALANELGIPLYRIDVASIVDRYVGETEKNLARIFEEAESDHALLLFDEADSLFSKRVEVNDAQDRYANMQINVLLNLIDDYSGFVILTTNLKGSMDTAFLRRVAFKVTFELPSPAERLALWKMHMPKNFPADVGLDLGSLAHEYKASGGEIRNAVYRAVLTAGPRGMITESALRRALALELEGAGNVVRRS